MRAMRPNPSGRTNGFSLVELLIVIMIVAILAGMVILATGSGGDNAEAVKILSDLDAVKTAMLAYAADHPSRITDPFDGWRDATDLAIRASIDRYMERPIDRALDVEKDPNEPIFVVFTNFAVTPGLTKALDKAVAENGSYEGKGSGGTTYTLKLRVR